MHADNARPECRDGSISAKVDALLDDQSRRWRKGDSALVEGYLHDHPELQASEDYLLDLIYHEVVLRTQRGAAPDLEEYLKRFPHLEDQLRLQFQIHQVISPEVDTHEGLLADTAHADAPPGGPSGPLPQVRGYAIQTELGHGAMGVVYRARHLGLNRLVALKMLRAGATRPLDLARFRAESELVARLDHANIVRVYDVGDQAGVPYFSMELVDGVSLAQALQGAPLPAAQAAALVRILAEAIETAHVGGIVHRDLKPANILLPGHDQAALGQPKITDFGLAKQMDAEAVQTRSGDIVGTPAYMAPEQARGRTSAVGPATDIYALGAILYETLAGRPPFRGETLWDTLDQVVTQEPPPLRQVRADVPRDLETICLKCLQKDPARRYPRAADLAMDLTRFLAHEPIRARPASVGELAWQWLRRHPTLTAVSATAAVVLLVLSVGHYLHLRTALDHALAAQELETGRSAVQAQLHQAESAVQAEQWDRAAELLRTAPDRLAPLSGRWPGDARLADLQSRLVQLQQQTSLHVSDQERYRQLLHRRAGVSFHAVGFTGLDAERNVQQMRSQVAEALRLFGLTPTGAEPLQLSGASYAAVEQATIAECCFEMLIDLADALTDALPEDRAGKEREVQEVLALLDRAAALPVPATVTASRRARVAGRPAAAPPAPLTRACEFFLAGTHAYREGRLTEAADRLQDALKIDPRHVGAQYALAVCYLKQRSAPSASNRLHLAVYRLSQCIDAQPGHVWPHLLRGYAHSELEEFAAAEADFAHVSKQAGADDVARYGVYVNRGLMRIRQGKLAEADADLTQAIQLKPDEYPAYANLAQVCQEQQRWVEAKGHLDRALALSPQPLKATLYRTRARLQQAQGRFDEALHDYEQAGKHEPRGLAAPTAAGDFLERARILLQQGKHVEAVTSLDAALALQPGLTAAHRLRAEALLNLDRFSDAVASLNHCLAAEAGKRQPLAALYLARGRAQSALGKFPEAMDDYTRALELQPDNAIACANRGWAYIVLDAPQLALRDFERVLALDHASADGHNGRGYARVRLGDCRKAVEDADRALKLSPARNSRNIYNASRTYAQAAAKIVDDRLQQPTRVQELRQQYQDRAVNLLRDALNSLPSDARAGFWKRTVEPDPALSPVRRSPGYLRLAQELQESIGTDRDSR